MTNGWHLLHCKFNKLGFVEPIVIDKALSKQDRAHNKLQFIAIYSI